MGRVLVGCESSGTVRDAFLRAGHDAISCDLLPTDSPGPHYQGDVRDLMGEHWDLAILHPTCTYLTISGVRWLYDDADPTGKNLARWEEMRKGAEFFGEMVDFPADRVAVENPVMHKYALAVHGKGKATQYVQPWMFGHLETKRTGLWLRNLPRLYATNDVEQEMLALPYAERALVHYASPGPDRWKIRSKTKEGFAEAMASQWGPLLP